MQIILLQDVKGQGKKDDIIKISDGYARNFILPKKLLLNLAGCAKSLLNHMEYIIKNLQKNCRSCAVLFTIRVLLQ